MNVQRVLAIARKESQELMRDRIYIALAFVLPMMMMFLFCWGMGRDVENVKLAILDLDHSAASRDYAGHFTNGKYFRLIAHVRTMREAEDLLANSKVKAVLVVPSGFEKQLSQGMPAEVQTLLDGSMTLSIDTIRSYVQAINGAASADIQAKYLARRFGMSPSRAKELMHPLDVRVRYLYNEEIKSIWMIAPELVLVIVMWVMPVLMSLSVVREKETGSIYNISASTTTRSEFLLGKLAPVVAVCVFNSFLLWAVAVYFFHAPFRGSVPLFSIALIAFTIGAVSVGMLASVFLQTQQSALLVVIIAGAIIAMRYSGMFIPLSDLDISSQVIAHLFPPAYFNTIVEGSFLKGASWRELAFPFFVLLGYPFVTFGIATALFRKVSTR